MKELAAIALAVLSILSYFLVATRLGFYQRWPVIHLLGALAAGVWLAVLLIQRRGWRRLYTGAARRVPASCSTRRGGWRG